MAKVLITDELSPIAREVLEERGIEVAVKSGIGPDKLRAEIGAYDGLVVQLGHQGHGRSFGRCREAQGGGACRHRGRQYRCEAATARGIVVIAVDQPLTAEILRQVRALPLVLQAKTLTF